MTDDLISRQAAIDAVEEITWYHQNQNKEMVSGANSELHQAWYKADDIYAALNNVPTAEKKGRWIPLSDGWAECSSCEHLERAAGLRWRYCPNCGARLEESE